MSTLSRTLQSGFTLLELVVVMFIIGLIASTPLMFIDNQDNQLRYEETLQKMELIRRAIYQRESYRNQPILSGFVVDNGVLPPDEDFELSPGNIDLAPIINKSHDYDGVSPKPWFDYSGWASVALLTPYHDVSPAGGATQLDTGKGYELTKGYRGRYIHQGLDTQGDLKDSWGELFDVSNAGTSYAYASTNPTRNITQEIKANDWSIALTDLSISITNNTGSDIVTTDNKSLALIVYQNASTASATISSAWNTYHFDVSVATGSTQSPIVTDWKKNGVTLVTPANERIPAGDHIVMFDPEVSAAPWSIFRLIPGVSQPIAITVSP